MGSVSLKLRFDINVVLVQTRYPGDRKPRNFGNFYCRTYMAMHECGEFEAPLRRGCTLFAPNQR